MANSQKIGLIGMPFDDHSSFLKGPANAPKEFRNILTGGSMNKWSETGVNILLDDNVRDFGDVEFSNEKEAFSHLQDKLNEVLDEELLPFVIGGDHSISYPILQVLAQHYPSLTVLHFDAHPDLYDEFKGNKLSHACPFARVMEEECANRLVQVGIRTMNPHLAQQAQRFHVEVHQMKDWQDGTNLNLSGPIYISFDIDALDPSCAPGVSHNEPGGLSLRQAIDVIQRISGHVVGADIVEFNPERDINQMTGYVCGKLFKEIAGMMLR